MKVRKALSLALALVLCLSLLPTAALAAGDFEITDGILIKYKGKGGDVVIPSGVTTIGEEAFANCTGLTSVTIPQGVTSIGAQAFSGCSALTGVTIPEGMTSIGIWAFHNCSSLTDITIPDSVTSIGEYAFSQCSGLTTATLGKGLTTIDKYLFEKCYALTSVNIPEGVTSIGWGAFNNCQDLTDIIIPEKVTSIDGYAFSQCISLTNITIPQGVTSIGKFAFYYCSGLTSVTLGKGLTDIDVYAFGDCSSLTSITIPPEVACLGYVWAAPGCEVKGAPGSYAELWAQDRGYTFVADRPFTTTPSQTAYPSTQKVNIDGKQVEFQMYALKDAAGNLTNYIKLRDLAYALNGTPAQFQVGYEGGVTVTSKTSYTANGSEMKTPFSGNRTYLKGSGSLRLNGIDNDINDFTLRDDNGGGYTYYQLRNIGQLLGFNVGWSADKGVFVETNKPYDPAN